MRLYFAFDTQHCALADGIFTKITAMTPFEEKTIFDETTETRGRRVSRLGFWFPPISCHIFVLSQTEGIVGLSYVPSDRATC